jgi:hypothetical protein
MSYDRIFNLKFREHVPTYQLGKLFPRERKKITQIALLELPISLLRQLIKQEKELRKLISLREWLERKNGRGNRNR